jgi:hypothetical protein
MPAVVLAPHLPLRQSVRVGPWELVPFRMLGDAPALPGNLRRPVTRLVDATRFLREACPSWALSYTRQAGPLDPPPKATSATNARGVGGTPTGSGADAARGADSCVYALGVPDIAPTPLVVTPSLEDRFGSGASVPGDYRFHAKAQAFP